MAKITVLVAAAVVIVSLLSPSSYIQNWGGSSYFKGFTDSSHAAASSCCLALCLAVFAFNEKKYEILKYILLGIFSATIFATGARVFLIPLGIILVYCVRADTNKKAVRIGIYFVGFLLAVALFIKTGMINKFIYVIEDPFGQSSSFFESFTSGRSKFWWVDLKDYFNSDLLCMITGHGFDYIYQLNLRSVGMEIWAHNDFINILVGAGIIGLSVYLGILYRGYKKILKSESGMVKFLLVIYVLFPAFFNGFYIYYHFLNSFIIFLVGIQYVNNRKQKKACGENIYG
ncbi:MAG: hypothetical protein HFI68_07600 [Lachnospiraceae bacterium]|nr:hypothetical protein [Lachnospiraceae bacterium]